MKRVSTQFARPVVAIAAIGAMAHIGAMRPPESRPDQSREADSVTVTGQERTGGVVLHARLDDEAITPAIARYLSRAIEEAEEYAAECLVIEMDTPGGLMQSTREIVKELLDSNVPVVMYVSPSGARAASAGVFITLATHVAAMAPGTHIGAAHPVQVGGLPGSPPGGQEDTTAQRGQAVMEEKVLNDAVAWVRSLADIRGRNADMAEVMVTESRTLVAVDAVEEGIVDLIAADFQELLEKIDGRTVELPRGTLTLMTATARVELTEMWWGEKLLGILANPNIAVILIILGFYGVLFELYSPGWGVPGTVGIACLLMGFFGLAVLPINIVGLALILLALALFVAEAFVTSFGALTIGGIACLIIGGLMLVDEPLGVVRVSLKVLLPVAIATGAITFFLLTRIVKAHRAPVTTGSEGLIGTMAVADDDFVPDGSEFAGYVRTHGELWRARAGMPAQQGDKLRITRVDGLTLAVERFE